MAEAHHATSYSSSIRHEHTNENHNLEVLQLVWKSGTRYWKKGFARTISKIKNGIYPAHVSSLFVLMGLVTALHFSTQNSSYDLVDFLCKFLPNPLPVWQVGMTCILVAVLYWLTICLAMRYTLKLLLMYKGYMFEARGKKVSMKTKVWGILVKIFIKWNSPSLYSFQGSLPRLPVPSVKDTMVRYLKSVRPLLDDKQYEKVRKESQEFEKGVGKRLQRYLVLKSWWSANYVSDWWQEYVYLRNRSPLMINSNVGACDMYHQVTTKQSVRAANVIYYVLQYRQKILTQKVKPIMAQGLVPLCSSQYEKVFNTVRVPGVEGDTLVHYNDSDYLLVMSKGCFYKMTIKYNGKFLNPHELKYQIDYILKLDAKASDGEKNLAALTAWERAKWAKVREKYFSTGVNKISMDVIDRAAFVAVLDDKEYKFDMNSSPSEMGTYTRSLLHGSGNNIWFDKSVNILFSKNGRLGVNVEHSFADAPVTAHIYEETCLIDIVSYDENGNLRGSPAGKMLTLVPERLTFEIKAELLKTIGEAYNDARKLIDDFEIKSLIHNCFGKGFIKTCKLSPDGYIQMALQLAYFRDQGKFSLTYEASMTRLYLQGRTEAVRPVTEESVKWVKAMEDNNSSAAERIRLLNNACNRHQSGYLDAMCSRGVDRHLFCLYVVSKYLEVDSPFLTAVISEPWRLSTSQTPHGQTSKVNLNKNPKLIHGGGGFGPVSYDGYGVCYVISGEDLISFGVSCMKGCKTTSSDRFVKGIVKAMADIKELFEQKNVKK